METRRERGGQGKDDGDEDGCCWVTGGGGGCGGGGCFFLDLLEGGFSFLRPKSSSRDTLRERPLTYSRNIDLDHTRKKVKVLSIIVYAYTGTCMHERSVC